jgi:hypothetical protein
MMELAGNWWMGLYAAGNFHEVLYTIRPDRPGADVYASIALSRVSTAIIEDPNPKFAVLSYIESWTTWQGGRESSPNIVSFEQQPSAIIRDCASITFTLRGGRVRAGAVINVFYL